MFEKKLKKTVFTLSVGDYPKWITDITFFLMRKYAERIGADFHVIRERKFLGWPAAYEKLQIYRLAQEMQNDWNIFFDADTMIHPETPDFTSHMPMDTVAHYLTDPRCVRFDSDRFFARDGRNIGSCNWCAIASSQCIELWKPLEEYTKAEAMAQIHATLDERAHGVTNEHLLDDFALSHNIAKYGLKCTTLSTILIKLGLGNYSYLVHAYKISEAEKEQLLYQALDGWEIALPHQYQGNTIPGWMKLKELIWLHDTAKTMRNIVEIGSWMGRSTHALATGCRGKVHAVDHFKGTPSERESSHAIATKQDVRAMFLENTKELSNIFVIPTGSVEAAAQFEDDSIDMIFIDGDHSFEAVEADIKAWAPKCRKLLCGHDREQDGVPLALGHLQIPFKKESGSIWSCRKEDIPPFN